MGPFDTPFLLRYGHAKRSSSVHVLPTQHLRPSHQSKFLLPISVTHVYISYACARFVPSLEHYSKPLLRQVPVFRVHSSSLQSSEVALNTSRTDFFDALMPQGAKATQNRKESTRYEA